MGQGARKRAHECGIRCEVSHPQPPGILSQSEKPLHADLLHPAGRDASVSREKLECGTDTELNRANTVPVIEYKLFLEGASEGNEQERRATVVHASDERCVLELR